MDTLQRDPSEFKGPVGSLRHRCAECLATGDRLLRCTGCRAVRYCSRQHQTAHRYLHKFDCNLVQRARMQVDEEEYFIRHPTEDEDADEDTPANAFETHVGRFTSLTNVTEYIRKRCWLATNLRSFGTLDGVREALGHLLDMLRLCRAEGLGIRALVPALMLRLDLDQECYDFVKWWATHNPDGEADWDYMAHPYLDIHGADAFESGDLWRREPEIDQVVSMWLLKLKLLVDLRDLKKTRNVLARAPRTLPTELQDAIKLAVVRSPLSAKMLRYSDKQLWELERSLVYQVSKLGITILQLNPNFMMGLFDPDEGLGIVCQHFQPGSWAQLSVLMRIYYPTFWETEGLLSLLEEARACAARALEDDIEDLAKADIASVNDGERPGPPRTAEQMQEDISANLVWEHLDWAVRNTSYLGPWDERPSEQYMRRRRPAKGPRQFHSTFGFLGFLQDQDESLEV